MENTASMYTSFSKHRPQLLEIAIAELDALITEQTATTRRSTGRVTDGDLKRAWALSTAKSKVATYSVGEDGVAADIAAREAYLAFEALRKMQDAYILARF